MLGRAPLISMEQ